QAAGPGVGGDHGPTRVVPALAVGGLTQEHRPPGVLAARDPYDIAAAQLPHREAGGVLTGAFTSLLRAAFGMREPLGEFVVLQEVAEITGGGLSGFGGPAAERTGLLGDVDGL